MRSDRNFHQKKRLLIGGAFTLMVWIFYFVRLIWGIGLMHDAQNNQAPLAHYLLGAIAVTVMVLLWTVFGALFDRRPPS